MSVSNIGRTTYNSYITLAANNKAVSKFTLPEAGKVYSLRVMYFANNRNTRIRGVIYSDNSGAPDALLGVTEEILSFYQWWTEYYFPEPITLAAGDYHIGIIAGSSDAYVRVQTLTGTNTRNSDTYSDGPSDPFGTPGTALTSELSVNINYIAGANQDVTKAYGAAVLVPDDIEVTKAVGFAVIAPNDHRIFKAVGYAVVEELDPGPLEVSKAVGYSVLSAPDALDVSKVVGYAVLSTEVNVAIAKVVGYAVLEEIPNIVRVTQQYVEAAGYPDTVKARVTQQYVEAAGYPDTVKARVTQQYIEVACLKGGLPVAPCVFVVT